MGNSVDKGEPVVLIAASRLSQTDIAPRDEYSTLPLHHQSQQSLASNSRASNEYSTLPMVHRTKQSPTACDDVEPSSPKSDVRLFVALFDYDARTSEDLTFKKGDYLEVKPENTAYDWCQAKSRSSQQEGYIPSNYVAEVNTLEAEE